MEQRQRRFDRDVRQIKGLLWSLVVAFTTATILLAVHLANGSHATIA